MKKAYTIHTGREMRVLANAGFVTDNKVILLAKDIEASMQYPGEVKVNLIREQRAIEFTR